MEGEFRLAHPVSARLTPASASAGRKFGLKVGAAFGVLAAIAWWRGHPTSTTVLGVISGLLILGGLIIPKQMCAVEDVWMKFAYLLSRVTTPIFMGVIYYVILTPIGIIRRNFGSRALVHVPGQNGTWFDRSASPRSSLDRLF